MSNSISELVTRFLEKSSDELSAEERKLLERIVQRHARQKAALHSDQNQSTFGQRVADRVAAFGGSWTFIILFGSVMLIWIVLNTLILVRWNSAFDPYPFILLNLVLSMLAALQAPIIMMSQNRQAAKDRQDAAHDYEVNLKAEVDILSLHQKVDALRERQWNELVALQHQQIQFLSQLIAQQQTLSDASAANDPSAAHTDPAP
jgi:uncharacterized membrane protein